VARERQQHCTLSCDQGGGWARELLDEGTGAGSPYGESGRLTGRNRWAAVGTVRGLFRHVCLLLLLVACWGGTAELGPIGPSPTLESQCGAERAVTVRLTLRLRLSDSGSNTQTRTPLELEQTWSWNPRPRPGIHSAAPWPRWVVHAVARVSRHIGTGACTNALHPR
jgi:hypothetical protein